MGKWSKEVKVFPWGFILIVAMLSVSCSATMEPGYYGGDRYYPHYQRPLHAPYGSLYGEAENLMKQAEQLEKGGKVTDAANIYYRVATTYPGSSFAPEALYRLGRIMGQLGRWHDANLYYLYLVNNYPQWNNVGQAYDELAKSFLMERRTKEAIDAGKRIPDEGRKNLIFGVAVCQGGNVGKAVRYLNAALSSPSMKNPEKISEDIIFLGKALDESQLQAILNDREASADLKSLAQAALGKRLIDTGRASEGQKQLGTALERLGPGHYLTAAIQSLAGAKPLPPAQPKAEPQATPTGEPIKVTTGEPGNPKKIGLMVPLSGSASSFGYQVMRGASLAIAIWNEQHPEDPVELVIQDTPPEVEATIKVFEKLVNEDKVLAVIGPMSRQGVEALESSGQPLPLLVLSMVPGDSGSAFKGYGSFVVRFLPDVKSVTERIVDYSIATLGYKNFAILYPEESFGQQVYDAFIQAVQSKGGQVVAHGSYASGTTNFKNAIENLIGKKEENKSFTDKMPFQALFLPDDLKTVSLIAPQLVQANIVGVTLLGSHLWDNPRFSSLSGGYLDGAYYVTPYFIQSTDEVSSAFKSRFQSIYKTVPQFLEAAGYDATNVILQIRSRAEKNRTGLLRLIQQGFTVSGSVTGVKNIDPYGVVNRSYKVITVRGSEPVKVAE